MMGLLNNLMFLNPLILWALAALPLLWLLLRITPPSPKLVQLPTTRFLANLVPDRQTSSHTPWWILLLRMIIAALVIFALARPVLNPSESLAGSGPVRFVIDNGWPSASTWHIQMRSALDLNARAGRENRDIYIHTTAPVAGESKPLALGPLTSSQAEAVLKAMEPQPWPADYKTASDLVSDNSEEAFWLGHGLDEGGISLLAEALKKRGAVTYFSPAPEHLPLLLKKIDDPEANFQLSLLAPDSIAPGRPVTIQAVSTDGSVIDQKTISLNSDSLPHELAFDIPDSLRGDVGSFKISGQSGAGGIVLLDENSKRRLVGILGPAEEKDTKPFIDARYYLRRALEPFSEIIQDDIQNILKRSPSVIILPDIAALPAQDLSALEKWVKNGGTLLRFAGPVMAKGQNESFLVPVPLRLGGGRSLDGSLTWESPAKLQAFPESSPFYGIALRENIPVRQQILAQPIEDIEKKTWAKLEDGTPLITASPSGKGLLIMIHTSAAPDWSDLPLSGVFVEILRKIVNISGNPAGAFDKADGFLQPIWVLDGFGTLKKPPATLPPVSAADFPTLIPSPEHPPGLYGREGFQQALNIGDHIKKLKTPSLDGIAIHQYGANYERDLMPALLYAALMLLLADWILMTVLMSGFRNLTRFASLIILTFLCTPALAQSKSDIEYADGFYLAYIKIGDPSLDTLTSNALANLSEALRSRTAVEPAGIAALDPEYDELVFFPLIFWPISPSQAPLTDKAVKNIQHYLDHGGTILFDTRDRSYSAGIFTGTTNANILRMITASLNIPPLEPLPRSHVLNRSFYLLNPGRPGGYDPGTLWVESSVTGRDGVSSILIGSHDWASVWAAGLPRAYGAAGRTQDMEFRFGINLVMYALTGNYKADQVHIPHILDRLGE